MLQILKINNFNEDPCATVLRIKRKNSYIFKIGQTVLIFELLASCIFKQFDLTNLPIELHKI